MLLFNSSLPSSLPTAFGFYYIFYFSSLYFFFVPSGLCDAVVVSWDCFDRCCTCDGFYFYFPFVLCCRLLCRENIGRFSVFSLKSQQFFFINHRSVTQGEKNDSTVYFFHWYLFIGHLYDYYFFVSLLLSCGGYKGFKEEEWALIAIVIVLERKTIVFNRHTNKQSTK